MTNQTTTKTRKDVLQEFRKSELLAAARVVFSKKGFHEATIDDIAREAGVAKGTVYLYFKSKQDIYLDALRDGISHLNSRMRQEAAGDEPASAKLRRLLATKIAFFDENSEFFQILQSELGRGGNACIADCEDLYFEQSRIIEGILQQGIREGTMRKMNTKKASFAITDLTRGIAIQRILGWSKTRLNEEVEFMFNLILKGVGK